MDNKGIGIAILIGLGLLLFFITKKGLSAPALASGCTTCQPLRLMPTGSLAKQYTNKEVWSISWNSDGLPEKVEIERHATEG